MTMLQTKVTGLIAEMLTISNRGPLATINSSGNWLENHDLKMVQGKQE